VCVCVLLPWWSFGGPGAEGEVEEVDIFWLCVCVCVCVSLLDVEALDVGEDGGDGLGRGNA
jgi:hypothetical protein